MKMEESLKRHMKAITETEEQIQRTKSVYRRRDLQRHLKSLRKEYRIAKMYLSAAAGAEHERLQNSK